MRRASPKLLMVPAMQRIRPSYCVVSSLVAVLYLMGPAVSLADQEALKREIENRKQQGAQIPDQIAQGLVESRRESKRPAKEDDRELNQKASLNGPAEQKVLSHVTGKEGIPFPPSDESVWMPVPTPDLTALQAILPTPPPTPTPYQRPFVCSKNETKREVYEQSSEPERTLVDILFIPEHLSPMEPAEVFGARVSVIPYGPNESKATLTRMEIYAVPCLPYRIRWTNTTRYFDSGLNAYRNYDKEPAGRGVLNPIMANALVGTTTTQRRK